MSDNKYLEKVAAKRGSAALEIMQAKRSRVPVFKKQDPKNQGLRMEKTSIMEKRALSSKSHGFKFHKTTSGVAKTNPKMPKTSKKLQTPNFFNQKVSNPNKNLIKSSALVTKAKDLARRAGEKGKGVLGHAGGKHMKDFARDKNLTGAQVQGIKSLTRKQLAAQAAVGATGAAGVYGAIKGKEKLNKFQEERQRRRLMRQYQRQYQQY